MNSFFKSLTAVLFLLMSAPAFAINIHALYLSSCHRELGVIVGVDNLHLKLLKLDGSLLEIPRYEIIFLAYYPMDVLPIRNGVVKDFPLLKVSTLRNHEMAELLSGWPIDFSDSKISFLTPNGRELVIDRDSIWALDFLDESTSVSSQANKSIGYNFVHPYAFETCPVHVEGDKTSKPLRVLPQQILSDPVTIKKELDRLKAGHEKVRDYDRQQKFYAVPQYYANKTSLGLWWNFGARYGASSNRTNITPILADEYSSGPFGFQRLFKTGSAPMMFSVHEEPQTQTYYRFKADYFHTQLMLDPNLILAGSSFNWQTQDMPNPHDARIVEYGSAEFGFDFGLISVNFYVGGPVDVGVRFQDQFQEQRGNLPRVGLTYQNHFIKIDAQTGNSNFSNFATKFSRFNAQVDYFADWTFAYSYITRKIEFSNISEFSNINTNKFSHQSDSSTHAFYAYRKVSYKFAVGAFLSRESVDQSYGRSALSESSKDSYLKGGLSAGLTF